MRFGIFVFDSARNMDPATLAKRAEELGFSSFWIPEHTVLPVNPSKGPSGSTTAEFPESFYQISDPVISLARASGATSTIKLGTGILLAAERNPLLTSKSLATLDRLSGGRRLVGIGTGWSPEEYAAMGGDFQNRYAQLREHVQALKTIWSEDEPEFHGRFYNFPPVKVHPKPVQTPHPPIFIGGGLGRLADRVFKRIVNWADGWVPVVYEIEQVRRGKESLTRLAAEAGRDPASIPIYVMTRGRAFRTRDEVKQLEEAGADEVVFWLQSPYEDDDALIELEHIAQSVM